MPWMCGSTMSAGHQAMRSCHAGFGWPKRILGRVTSLMFIFIGQDHAKCFVLGTLKVNVPWSLMPWNEGPRELNGTILGVEVGSSPILKRNCSNKKPLPTVYP